MTVYPVRAAVIPAGGRHAAPVIDKRLHLYIVSISANILKHSNIYMPPPGWTSRNHMLSRWLASIQPSRSTLREDRQGECGAV